MSGILELCGKVVDGHCGYCQKKEEANLGEEERTEKSETGNSQSLASFGHFLTSEHLMCLLECGWSSSGKYIYKPIMDKTCCPQYTIRLDSHKFFLSRSQRRVLRVMNEYLKNDVKPKCAPVQEMDTTEHSSTATPKEESSSEDKPEARKDRSENPFQKKKEMRRERCFQRWRERGLDVEEEQRKRWEKEELRRRTIESYLGAYDETWKHKLEVRLVSIDGEEIKQRDEESFQLYRKYQMTVHNDEDPTAVGHRRFLISSPMKTPDGGPLDTEPPYGSYHQWYILDGKVIAVGVVDILPRCVSSKYMYYDPDYNFLSLGTYTALREIKFTKRLSVARPQLKYYYMGYYIQSCPKMRYKGKFQPSDLLCDQSFTWVPLSECSEMFAKSESPFVVFRPDVMADRRKRQDLNLLVDGRAVPYAVLDHLIPNYSTTETEAIRSDLDLLAGFLAATTLQDRFLIFVPFIQRLAAGDSEDDEESENVTSSLECQLTQLKREYDRLRSEHAQLLSEHAQLLSINDRLSSSRALCNIGYSTTSSTVSSTSSDATGTPKSSSPPNSNSE